MRMRRASRTGLTLTEVLVVVFIIAILLALIVPAVFRARARARQAQCLGRMSDLGKGLLQFAGSHNDMLPNSGTFLGGSSTLRWGSYRHGWVVDILPYIDPAAADSWDHTKSYVDIAAGSMGGGVGGGNAAISQTRKEQLVCPADYTGEDGDLSYVVNGGANLRWTWPTANNLESFVGVWMNYDGDGELDNDEDDKRIARSLGLMWPGTRPGDHRHDVNRPVIADGTGQTILLSENLHSSPTYYVPWWSVDPEDYAWQNWANADPNFVAFRISDDICPNGDCNQVNWSLANSDQATDNPLGFPEKINGVLDTTRLNRSLPGTVPVAIKALRWPWPYPSSYHPRGVNVVFADGHGRFLSEDLDGATYAKLVSPAASRIPKGAPVYQAPLDDASY